METPTPLTTLRVDLVMEIKKFSFSLVNRAPGLDSFLECHYPTSNAANDYRGDQASWIDGPHSASGFYCYKQASVRTYTAGRHGRNTGEKGGLTNPLLRLLPFVRGGSELSSSLKVQYFLP